MSSEPKLKNNLTLPKQQGLGHFLPCLQWMSNYQASDLPQDLLAGLFLVVLLVPQAMAYALLADLPPQVGLYASIAPAIIYALVQKTANNLIRR